jgi:hypothetical protein
VRERERGRERETGETTIANRYQYSSEDALVCVSEIRKKEKNVRRKLSMSKGGLVLQFAREGRE